jgi:hypothetical protein
LPYDSGKGKRWMFSQLGEALPLMECGSARPGTDARQIYPGWIRCLAWTVFFLSSMGGMAFPYPTWAAVYQCRDRAGKNVLTDRPAQLRNCHVLSGRTTSGLTPSASPSQDAPPPVSSENPPEPPYDPAMAMDQPSDAEWSLPPPDPAASSSPSQPQPCSRGLNPLNPLSAPPCVRSDQSGANPPENVQTPVP